MNQVLLLDSTTTYYINVHGNSSFPQFSGDESWTLVEPRPDHPCRANRRSTELSFKSHNKIHVGGTDITFHGYSNLTRITVIDKDRNSYSVNLTDRSYQTAALNEELFSTDPEKLQKQLNLLLREPHDRFILLTHSTDDECTSAASSLSDPDTVFREWLDATIAADEDASEIIHLGLPADGITYPDDVWPFSGDPDTGYYFFSGSTGRTFFDSQEADDPVSELLIRFDGRQLSLDPGFSQGTHSGESLSAAYFSPVNPHLDTLFHDRKLFHTSLRYIPLGSDGAFSESQSVLRKTWYWYDGQEKTVIAARNMGTVSGDDADDISFPIAGNPQKGYFFYRQAEKQLWFDDQLTSRESAEQLPLMYDQVTSTSEGGLFAVSNNTVNYLIDYGRTLTPLYIVGNYQQLAGAVTEINSLDESVAQNMIPVVQTARSGQESVNVQGQQASSSPSVVLPTPTPTPGATPEPTESAEILVEQPVHTGFFDRSVNQMVLFSLVLLDDAYVGVRLPPLPLPDEFRAIRLVPAKQRDPKKDKPGAPHEDMNSRLSPLLTRIGIDPSEVATREWLGHDWEVLFSQISSLIEYFGDNVRGSLPEQYPEGAQPLDRLLQSNQARLRIADTDHIHYVLYSPKGQRLFICRLIRSDDNQPHITREPLLTELQFGRDTETEPNITSVLSAVDSVLVFTDTGLVLQVTEESLKPRVDDAVNGLAELLLSVDDDDSVPPSEPSRRSAAPAPEQTTLHDQADLFIKNIQKVEASGFVIGIDQDRVPTGLPGRHRSRYTVFA